MPRRRFNVLELHAKRYGWRRMVELGVHRGEVMRWMLSQCPRLEYVGVDLWTECQPESEAVAPVLKKGPRDTGARHYPHQRLNEQLCRTIARAYRDRAELLKMSTTDAAELIEDGSVDCVFIDADHRPDAAEQDIRAWLPKLTETGWLFGHDYNIPPLGKRVKSLLPSVRLFDDSVYGLPASVARQELPEVGRNLPVLYVAAEAPANAPSEPVKRPRGRPRKVAA